MLLLILMIFRLSVFFKTYFLFDSSKEKKCIFGIHDPLGLRYLFQLGVGLSSLRYHKNVNFIDTRSDKCFCNQGIEDTNHFLFLSFFPTQRAALAINVIAILQIYDLTHLGNQSHMYLYGHRTMKNPLVDN